MREKKKKNYKLPNVFLYVIFAAALLRLVVQHVEEGKMC